MIEFTGYTADDDEIEEFHDEELNQYPVTIKRHERKGLPDIVFSCENGHDAHQLFLALCNNVTVEVETDKEPERTAYHGSADTCR